MMSCDLYAANAIHSKTLCSPKIRHLCVRKKQWVTNLNGASGDTVAAAESEPDKPDKQDSQQEQKEY